MVDKGNDVIISNKNDISKVGKRKITKSMQLYQAIYNDITGKTEELGDSYDNFLIFKIDDIFQLEYLFKQFLEQYQIEGFNVLITVFHIKSNQERFSSFDRFQIYNVNNSSPIERIHIELNILILPPRAKNPQNYKILIDIISSAAVLSKNKKDIPEEVPIKLILKAIQKRAVDVRIEYIDYIIARSISDLLRDWIKSVEEVKVFKDIKKIQSKSHYTRFFIPALFFSISFIFSIIFSKKILDHPNATLYTLSIYMIVSVVVLYLSKEIGIFMGRKLERHIDSINTNELSFIKINSGDEKQFNKYTDRESSEKAKAIKTGVISLLIGIFSSIIGAIIYNIY